LVTLLEFIYTPVQISNILILTVCFKLINFVFQIFPFFGPVSSIKDTAHKPKFQGNKNWSLISDCSSQCKIEANKNNMKEQVTVIIRVENTVKRITSRVVELFKDWVIIVWKQDYSSVISVFTCSFFSIPAQNSWTHCEHLVHQTYCSPQLSERNGCK
jgi:hypothetical protein